MRFPEGVGIKFSKDADPILVDKDGRIPSTDEDGEPTGDTEYATTTIGRAIFNDNLPEGMPFYNYELTKKNIQALIGDCFEPLGRDATLRRPGRPQEPRLQVVDPRRPQLRQGRRPHA